MSKRDELVPQGVGPDTAHKNGADGGDQRNGIEWGVKGEWLRGKVGDPGVEAWCAESAVGQHIVDEYCLPDQGIPEDCRIIKKGTMRIEDERTPC